MSAECGNAVMGLLTISSMLLVPRIMTAPAIPESSGATYLLKCWAMSTNDQAGVSPTRPTWAILRISGTRSVK